MLMNIGLGFLGLGLISFLLGVICFGFCILLDKDVLSTKIDKLFAVAIISWALGVVMIVIDLITNYSEYAQ
jgi:hypothetical protein|nr:MAG TPA: hypothetical protein [Caudoviricetes sp.]